ncbi:MAG: hypothetical protein KGY80_06935 [Candidatus Thorarchaeota archaeon]|nr:hypothetical protein [Candidatus Thorarchaeota archaeon]
MRDDEASGLRTNAIENNERGKGMVFIPKTYGRFCKLIEKHPEVRKYDSFEESLLQTRRYYQIRNVVEKGKPEKLSYRGWWRELSRRFGVSQYTIKGWFSTEKLPKLLRLVMEKEQKLKSGSKNTWRKSRFLKTPETFHAFQEMLNRHPHLMTTETFEEKIDYVIKYYQMRANGAATREMSHSEMARSLQVPRGTLVNWVYERTRPNLITQVLRNERLRIEYEATFPSASNKHRIDLGDVRRAFPFEVVSKNEPVSQISDRIVNLINAKEINNRIIIIDFHRYNPRYGATWLKKTYRIIDKNREKIEEKLNENCESKISCRLSTVSNTLFIWRRSKSMNLIHYLQDELFFFDKPYHRQLIETAKEHLGLSGNYEFSKVLRQLARYTQVNNSDKSRIISDLRPESNHIQGKVLYLLMEILNYGFREIIQRTESIGEGHQWGNPNDISDFDLHCLLSRLFASIVSDGTIEEGGRIYYYEKNAIRRKKVKEALKKLGKLHLRSITDRQNKVSGFTIPATIGRILVNLGIPVGDKVLQGIQIPDFILNGPPDFQTAYLEDLIPEEGWVSISKQGNCRIGFARSAVIHDPAKIEKYPSAPVLPGSIINYVKESGKKKYRTYGKENVSDLFYQISITNLRSEAKNKSEALQLLDIVNQSLPSLLKAERGIAENNGIRMKKCFVGGISLSDKTERMSVRWQTSTSSNQDAALWALVAPPNDRRKNSRLKSWLSKNRQVARAAKEKKRLLNQVSSDGSQMVVLG